MPFDYIITGKESEMIKWAEYAYDAGIIACIGKTFHDDCCSNNGCCGIFGEGVGLEVMRIENAEEFIGIKHESAIMFTRKPVRQRPGDDLKAKRLIKQFLSCMHSDDVKCYEALANGHWCEFEH